MNSFIEVQKKAGRENLVLTCHKEKISLYKEFGFTDLGISVSSWGGEIWHEMRLALR